MAKLGLTILGWALGLALVALKPVVVMTMGAIAGWVAGFVFPQVFDTLAMAIFDKAVPAWQIGAMLGFVGGFLRPRIPKRAVVRT